MDIQREAAAVLLLTQEENGRTGNGSTSLLREQVSMQRKDNLMISTKNLFIVYTLKVLRREISLICHKKEESGDVLSKTWMTAVANRQGH